MILGIDISRHQGDFNLQLAKNTHELDFVIIKAGGGDNILYKDRQFEANYKKAKEAGLLVGAYFYGHALTEEKAKAEALYFLDLIKEKQFELPIYYDVEGDMLNLSKRALTDIVTAFCDTISEAGYYAGVYGSQSTFKNYLFDKELQGLSHWVARWSINQPTTETCDIWQFGGETNYIRHPYINGLCTDQNYLLNDQLPIYIKEMGYNGFSIEPKKTVEELAQEVIAGYWGNGSKRKELLEAAGYDYRAVQSMVNKIIRGY